MERYIGLDVHAASSTLAVKGEWDLVCAAANVLTLHRVGAETAWERVSGLESRPFAQREHDYRSMPTDAGVPALGGRRPGPGPEHDPPAP